MGFFIYLTDMDCHVCFSSFDSIAEERTPRMLKCGHSFCTKCIDGMISRNTECTKCFAPIIETSSRDLPINYALTELIDISHLDNCVAKLELSKEPLCNKHNKKKIYACVVCNKIVCEVGALLDHSCENCEIVTIYEERLHIKLDYVKKCKENLTLIRNMMEVLKNHPIHLFKSYITEQQRIISDFIKEYQEAEKQVNFDIENVCGMTGLELFVKFKKDFYEKSKRINEFFDKVSNKIIEINEFLISKNDILRNQSFCFLNSKLQESLK